jgi:hypothetical protein
MTEFEMMKLKMELTNLGIDIDKFKEYQILCLPENLESAVNISELYDTDSSIILSKQLKIAGLKCANSFDLGIKAGTLERRNNEFWLGLIWITGNMAIPIFNGVVANLLTPNITNQSKPMTVHISLYIQKNESLTKIKYDGDPETLIKVLNSLDSDNKPEKKKI